MHKRNSKNSSSSSLPSARPRRLARLGRPALLALALQALAGASPTALAHTVTGQESGARTVMRAYFKHIEQARAIAHGRFETLESRYELGYVLVQANA